MEGKQKTQEAQEENDEERIVSWLAIGESLEFSSSVCDEAVQILYTTVLKDVSAYRMYLAVQMPFIVVETCRKQKPR